MDENIPSKWTCQFCKKEYSHNYPYKAHLKRCLIHNEEREDKNDILNALMESMKIELTNNLKTEINNMLIELKNDMKTHINFNDNNKSMPKKTPNYFNLI